MSMHLNMIFIPNHLNNVQIRIYKINQLIYLVLILNQLKAIP